MSDCLTNCIDSDARDEAAETAASPLATARCRLEPALTRVIDALAAGGDTGSFFTAGTFIQALLERLRTLRTESELLVVLLDVSLIGFQGFNLSEPVQRAVCSLIAESEALALKMTTATALD